MNIKSQINRHKGNLWGGTWLLSSPFSRPFFFSKHSVIDIWQGPLIRFCISAKGMIVQLSATKVYITIRFTKVVLQSPLKICHNTGFLRLVFSYPSRVFNPHIQRWGSKKTRILTYFTEWTTNEILTKYYPFTTSEIELDYICQKLNVRVAYDPVGSLTSNGRLLNVHIRPVEVQKGRSMDV